MNLVSFLVLFHKTFQVTGSNWLRAKARMDRWKEEVTLVQNETRWMHCVGIRRKIWEGREKESDKRV